MRPLTAFIVRVSLLALLIPTALGQMPPDTLDVVNVSASRGAIRISGVHGGILTPGARPYLVWRYAGEIPWREEFSSSIENHHEDGAGVTFDAKFTIAIAHIWIRPDLGNTWQISGTLKHTGMKPIELARFHYLDGPLAAAAGLLELQGNGDFPRLVRSGTSLPSSRAELERIWNGMNARWPRMPDPIHDANDWSLSTDTAVFTSAWDQPGWGFGFTGPGTAFGEIGMRTSGKPTRFYVGMRLDNVLLDPRETRTLESALIWHGDWQTGLRWWARATAAQLHPIPSKPPMAGYCSWYQRGMDVNPEDLTRAAREFQSWPETPGGRTVQVDSGWQVGNGDWQPNKRFAAAWKDLPGEIRKTGSIPGTYLVPTMVGAESSTAKQHPEWIQRMHDGQVAIDFPDGAGRGYYLDPDRPDVRDFMRDLFVQAQQEGWGYVKVDFTYGISTARSAFDRKKTSFESHRGLYQLFREGAGPNMLLSACVGEPGRYAVGFVDIARLGGDTGNDWKTVKGNLARLLTLTATNGVWWQGDPDVYYMRKENSKLSEEESYLLTGTVGMFGGLFLTSDWPSQWTDDRADAVREFWTNKGVRRPDDHRVLWTKDGVPAAYRVSYNDGLEPRHRIAIYNWTDQASDIRVSLKELQLSGAAGQPFTTGRSKALQLVDGSVISPAQPAHSLRILDLNE